MWVGVFFLNTVYIVLVQILNLAQSILPLHQFFDSGNVIVNNCFWRHWWTASRSAFNRTQARSQTSEPCCVSEQARRLRLGAGGVFLSSWKRSGEEAVPLQEFYLQYRFIFIRVAAVGSQICVITRNSPKIFKLQFKVIQGHWSGEQSKTHMRLPISH